nr:MAG TPA: YABBY protein [Caudoviricetes sp.]
MCGHCNLIFMNHTQSILSSSYTISARLVHESCTNKIF